MKWEAFTSSITQIRGVLGPLVDPSVILCFWWWRIPNSWHDPPFPWLGMWTHLQHGTAPQTKVLTYKFSRKCRAQKIRCKDIQFPPSVVRDTACCKSGLVNLQASRPPDLYYNDHTSRSYTTSSRIQYVQAQMTHRALELLSLADSSFILDIGCGSGLSGEILSNGNPPHTWIGVDISSSMLAVAKMTRDVDGDLMLGDIGQGLPFRPGSFDAAVSISVIQWLCNAESGHENDDPDRRLQRFFSSLYVSLRRGGRAVLQFYPHDKAQREMITGAATKAGFGAGVLEDDGGTKNAKLYLVCTVGGGDITGVVSQLQNVQVEDSRKGRCRGRRGTEPREIKGSKAWINRKREQMQRKGKVVKASSKYTGRRRRVQF